METIPYTYKLIFKPTGQYYYGVRYAKNCNPSDLWDKYFSSSKHIHNLIKEFGLNSFIVKITKTFTNKEDAINYEHKILTRVKADRNGKFINKTVSKAIPSNEGLIIINHIQLGFETFHDPKLPIPFGWTSGFSESHKKSMSIIRKGKLAHNKGKRGKSTGPCSESRKLAISKARKLTPKITCPHCNKMFDGGNFKRFHGENCKLNPNINPEILKERSKTNQKSYNTQKMNKTFNYFKRKID